MKMSRTRFPRPPGRCSEMTKGAAPAGPGPRREQGERVGSLSPSWRRGLRGHGLVSLCGQGQVLLADRPWTVPFPVLRGSASVPLGTAVSYSRPRPTLPRHRHPHCPAGTLLRSGHGASSDPGVCRSDRRLTERSLRGHLCSPRKQTGPLCACRTL